MPPIRMDDLKLIELVKQNKHLYDKYHCGYHDFAKKSVTWKAISAALGSSVDNCRKRFRCLRDRFTKEKRSNRRTKEDMLEDPSLPIVYKKMMFLWDHLLHRGSCDGSSDVETEEVANFPEIIEGDEVEKRAQISDEPMETELIIDENNDVEIQEVVIYAESGSASEYPQDDTHTVGAYFETKLDSNLNVSNENDDAGSEEMDSESNHSDESEDGVSAKEKAEMDSSVKLSNDHGYDSKKKVVNIQMDSSVNHADEHPNENDAVVSTKKVPKETSEFKQENSDTCDVPEIVEVVIKSSEQKMDTPNNCGVQKTPEISIVTQEQTRVLHAYTKPVHNSENVPRFKRRRNRSNVFSYRTNNQHQKVTLRNSGSGVPPNARLPKSVSTTKVSKASKTANVAFCTVIKSYLDKINRPDKLSAARLQILKILHNELYSSYK